MKNKIIWKFLGIYAVLVFISVLVLQFFVNIRLRDYYEQEITDKLKSNVFLVSDIFNKPLLNYNYSKIRQLTKTWANTLKVRITVIDRKGSVIADSEKDLALMDNHIDTLEIIETRKSGFGESLRFSDTLGITMKYVCVPIKADNRIVGFIRLALPSTDIELQLRVINQIVLFGGIVAVLVAFVVAYFISKSITKPIIEMTDIATRISKGDFSKKALIASDDEFGMLAKSLNKMADELRSKIENLKKLNTIRTDFVANISHELKTPLTAIKGFTETLEDSNLDDKQTATRFISIIKNHVERIGNIINDLLSLSELELGKNIINKESFNLKELIDEVLLGFKHILGKKRHSVQVKCTAKNLKITADKNKIEQILINLIDNAIKYTPNNGKITISTNKKDGAILIEIADTGVGIPNKHLDRIFERFYRVDKARSRQVGGTGLGLAIVKHIVLLHNGQITVESNINQGTKFTIILPT